MSDDDDLDQWIRAVVAAAGSDAPKDELVQEVVTPQAVARRRWPVTLAAATVAVLGVGAIAWAAARPDDDAPANTPTTDEAVETVSPATTDSVLPATTTPPTVPTSVEPATSTTIPERQLVRPVIDLADCLPTWALEGDVRDVAGVYIYGYRSELPVQLYVPVGEPVDGRFAVVVRDFTTPRLDPDKAIMEVNGQPASAHFASPTWGDLMVRFPDGSEAYLRTSTMTQDELIALASTLAPRPADATIPAFDSTGDAFELVDEAVTPFTIGPVTLSACQLDIGGWLRAAVFDGPPLGYAIYLTDRPEGSVAMRELDDGRILVVTGRQDTEDRFDDALASIRNAGADEWAQLTATDRTDFEPFSPPTPPAPPATGS